MPMSAGDRVDLVRRMRDRVPSGTATVDGPSWEYLAAATDALAGTSDGPAELARFQAVRTRGIARASVPDLGRTVVVTGGTGCIGTALLEALAGEPHRRIVSLSRGVTRPERIVPGVEYEWVDVRSPAQVRSAFRRIRPDSVFHLAAVRDPGAAEREVRRTVETNVLGSRAVFRAAEEFRADRLVFASTGKAVRYFTRDVYAATKKLGEALLTDVSLPIVSAVRFTHVVDNSLILGKLWEWCAGAGPIRLHSPDIAFYGQSARESAQLMTVAAARSSLVTLRNLEWPFTLLDLALGVRATAGSRTPIHFCGFEAGYESGTHPASYDPRTAGETGPLVNALESYGSRAILDDQVNQLDLAVRGGLAVKTRIAEIAAACVERAPDSRLRETLADAVRAALRAVLHAAPPDHVARLARLASAPRPGEPLGPDHGLVSAVIAESTGARHVRSAG